MTLPVALLGTDLIGQARTGTGKTLGFGIPLLQRTISPGEADYEELAAPGKPQALVVTPTRELTIQVAKDLVTASTVRTVRILTIYGGVAYDPQLDQLKAGVDVVVGTPGRLLDLANRGVLDLSHIKVLVLDEADEMLDLGFLPDVERILRKTPELRQTMLFSATMPSAVIGLARTHMRHPLNIRAESHDDSQMVPTTAQFVYRAHDLDKPEVVARILQADDRGRVMIFCRTKREASRLTDDLIDRGFSAAAIHGDLNQQARERALTRFRGDKVDVLICTDVAARGIDVEGVTHVINNTCPEDEKAYVHRIGRTGRAGASGIAVTFVDWADLVRWKTINKALDLPYDEPQEIYSTSPELYHDLGIPSEAKGRIKPPREPAERQERMERPARDKTSGRRGERDRGDRVRSHDSEPKVHADSGAGAGATGTDRPARKRPNRNRRRLRSGQPVEGAETTEHQATGHKSSEHKSSEHKSSEHKSSEHKSSEHKSSEQRSTERKSDADVTAKTAVPPTAESSTQAAEAPTAERKPRSRNRRRRGADANGAAGETNAVAAETSAPQAAEVAPQAAVAAPVERASVERASVDASASVEAPAKRTRSRRRATEKSAEASAPQAAVETAAAVEAPVAVKAPAASVKAPAAEAPAKKTARKRTTKKAAANPAADQAGESAAEVPAAVAPVAEAPVAEKPAVKKKAVAKKAAKKTVAEKPAADVKGEAAPKKSTAKKTATKTAAAKTAVAKTAAANSAPAKTTVAKKAVKKAPVKKSAAGVVVPTFTAPE
ncbi:DEAD/DEAH box helicase [Streptomyces sp. SID13031]|uniref:DEAD/DEAH box helicase n=1 Tax=Streptomyces sp. SID13031 TaxID=2706046 RepID=UPI0013CB2794|nr:DEAD/DEAH box helicase [Streptomyces sp. SID13031]NEA32274.1 DEAD/DEAH box helicase [Streptomyces sp. SID13031]